MFMMIIVMLLLKLSYRRFPEGFVKLEYHFQKILDNLVVVILALLLLSLELLGQSCRILGNISRYFQRIHNCFLPLWLPVHADGPISNFYKWFNCWLIRYTLIVYPVYLKIQLLKVFATSAGVVLGVNPILLLILAIFFIVLKIFKYVSLASIVAQFAM